MAASDKLCMLFSLIVASKFHFYHWVGIEVLRKQSFIVHKKDAFSGKLAKKVLIFVSKGRLKYIQYFVQQYFYKQRQAEIGKKPRKV